MRPDICALHGAVRICTSPSASEQIAEDSSQTQVTEDILEIGRVKIKPTAAGGAVECRHAELVILSSLLCIAENRICLGSFLELVRRFGITGIHIRMIFLRQLAVCLLDLLFTGIPADAQHLVVISLLCHIFSRLIRLPAEHPFVLRCIRTWFKPPSHTS